MMHFFSSQVNAVQHASSNKVSPGHVFLQIIIHFWFNQNSMELYSQVRWLDISDASMKLTRREFIVRQILPPSELSIL
jgi:hypothetical protein